MNCIFYVILNKLIIIKKDLSLTSSSPFAFAGKKPSQRAGWYSQRWQPGHRGWAVQTECHWLFRYRCLQCSPADTHRWASRPPAHIYHICILYRHMQSDGETHWQEQTCWSSGVQQENTRKLHKHMLFEEQRLSKSDGDNKVVESGVRCDTFTKVGL